MLRAENHASLKALIACGQIHLSATLRTSVREENQDTTNPEEACELKSGIENWSWTGLGPSQSICVKP